MPVRPRPLHLTEDHVARVTRPVEDFAYPSTYTRATEADYVALVDRLMAERPDGPLHIFAYGSLIWNPTFEAVARWRAAGTGSSRWSCGACAPRPRRRA